MKSNPSIPPFCDSKQKEILQCRRCLPRSFQDPIGRLRPYPERSGTEAQTWDVDKSHKRFVCSKLDLECTVWCVYTVYIYIYVDRVNPKNAKILLCLLDCQVLTHTHISIVWWCFWASNYDRNSHATAEQFAQNGLKLLNQHGNSWKSMGFLWWLIAGWWYTYPFEKY